jgi:hypothetical protein
MCLKSSQPPNQHPGWTERFLCGRAIAQSQPEDTRPAKWRRNGSPNEQPLHSIKAFFLYWQLWGAIQALYRDTMKPHNSQPVKNSKTFPRQQKKKLHRQKEIVAAAFEVFATHAHEATSIKDCKNALTMHSIAAILLF